MKPFEYLEPASLDSAISVLSASHSRARLISGGSDLLGELKEGTANFDRLVSLAAIEGLRGIQRTSEGLRIGAMTTIVEIEYAAELTGPYRLLAEAARSVATPEVRNQGTLGGNLCQRPRCLHYRNGLTACLKKGGTGCPASEQPYQAYLSIFGGPNCYATNPSDLAPPLIALDAAALSVGPAGQRQVPLEQFHTGPESDSTRENVLLDGEILMGVVIPEASAGWRGIYSKGRERTAGDFAVVSAAVGFELADGVVLNARIVLGSVAPTPVRSRDAEAVLEGQAPTQDIARRAADVALANAQPLSHNAYKIEQLHALVSRGIMRLANNNV